MQPTKPPLPQTVLDLLLDAVCVVDAHGAFVHVSAAGERVFGYPPDEMIGRPMIDFVFPEDRARTLDAVTEIIDGHLYPHFENRYVHKNGHVVHIMWSARWSESDQVRVAVARDISELRHADAVRAALYAISEAAHTEEDFPALFLRIHQIVGALLPASAFTVALRDSETGNLSFPYHVDERNLSAEESEAAQVSQSVVQTGTPQTIPADTEAEPDTLGVPLVVKQNTLGALIVKRAAQGDRYSHKDIELLQFVSTQIASAIERKQTHLRLLHRAGHDPLTALPNRALFHDRLQTALRLAERNKAGIALLYIDLDRFKLVNDSLGHDVGDLLLQEISGRLVHNIRVSDTAARLGGDEFVVLLNNTSLPEHAVQVAETIRAALNVPYAIGGHEITITPSIGVACYPTHGNNCEQLIKHADQAMYDAKNKGGNQLQLDA